MNEENKVQKKEKETDRIKAKDNKISNFGQKIKDFFKNKNVKDDENKIDNNIRKTIVFN